ncbi:hypothetical protein DSCO28_03710 [Desulfosarcina ovata subsp. sediminis]|uniref:Flagellar protein n=1 Tax=Desulfosarcina ovata subsp. sediminis TaxID=885957 RepID=A0A5K7ZHR8_9BACT|nr:flagellar biosynthetic protein FliO [Desulfosarcina ovata]BBO79805.1 hypothetical protein DSCO28_03710 [Desulfosarcina ovata subsp. sediminis]
MNAAPDMLTAGVKMIASLGVVLSLILLMLYGIRKLTRQRVEGPSGKSIRILESHYLGVKKSICLVGVPGKVLVLGVTSDRISLLDTLDETTVSERLPENTTQSFGPMFAERLKIFRRGRMGKDDR